MNREEYKAMIKDFSAGGAYYYEVPTMEEFKRGMTAEDQGFWSWFMKQNNYGADADVFFMDMEVEMGRMPTFHELTDRVVEHVKTNWWSKKFQVEWNPAREDMVRLRVSWWYTSHMIEVFTLTQLKNMYPDCKVWESQLVDRVFGVDIVFEDSETGYNYYIHITKEGNDFMSKEDRGFCKDSNKKWHQFKRDFSRGKGHVALKYGRGNNDSTKYLGGQPVFFPNHLRDFIEGLRADHKLFDYDRSEDPKELKRFNQFIEDHDIVE